MAQEISSDFSEENIIANRTRHRRQAYLTVLQQPEQLHAYFSAFAIGLRRLHRDQLPPPPRSWRELQSHPNREGFLAAAEKEYRDLERRQTFRPVPKTPDLKLLPLIQPANSLVLYARDWGGVSAFRLWLRLMIPTHRYDSSLPSSLPRYRLTLRLPGIDSLLSSLLPSCCGLGTSKACDRQLT